MATAMEIPTPRLNNAGRFVVNEELLAAGAPVAANWIADRQSAPLLLRYGTDAQQQLHLPPIIRGEAFFCIGMSEPNAGSDLAAIGSRARRDGTGWVLNGRKVWTTNAHRSHYMIAPCGRRIDPPIAKAACRSS